MHARIFGYFFYFFGKYMSLIHRRDSSRFSLKQELKELKEKAEEQAGALNAFKEQLANQTKVCGTVLD